MTKEEQAMIEERIKWLEGRRRAVALKGEALLTASIEGEILALNWVQKYFRLDSDDTQDTPKADSI